MRWAASNTDCSGSVGLDSASWMTGILDAEYLMISGGVVPGAAGGQTLLSSTELMPSTVDGQAITCTRKEFDLLAYLAARPGEVVTREELYAAVWREPYGRPDKTIDVHLSWLRRKLGETAATPRYLHTIRGVGVKLVDPT